MYDLTRERMFYKSSLRGGLTISARKKGNKWMGENKNRILSTSVAAVVVLSARPRIVSSHTMICLTQITRNTHLYVTPYYARGDVINMTLYTTVILSFCITNASDGWWWVVHERVERRCFNDDIVRTAREPFIWSVWRRGLARTRRWPTAPEWNGTRTAGISVAVWSQRCCCCYHVAWPPGVHLQYPKTTGFT